MELAMTTYLFYFKKKSALLDWTFSSAATTNLLIPDWWLTDLRDK